MAKKLISVLTLVAFSIFTWSCSIYSTNKINRDQIPGKIDKNVQVLRVMKTSGEFIEFSEEIPGYIHIDAIVSSTRQPIPLSEVELIWVKEKNAPLSTVVTLVAVMAGAAVIYVVIYGIAALIAWGALWHAIFHPQAALRQK